MKQKKNMKIVTGPCEFLVMYDITQYIKANIKVTGPCEFLVMYDYIFKRKHARCVTEPCEFLVMYDIGD